MFFEITNVNKTNLTVYQVKMIARQYVLLCKKGATEEALNKYFIDNYKTLLVQVCLRIILNAKYSFNGSGSLIVTMPNKKLDKLASIITFGTGKLTGSNILRHAFGQE